MRVERRMKRDVVAVRPTDSVLTAMDLIRRRGIRHLPVVDGGQVVGMVTDRDIRQAAASPATSLSVHLGPDAVEARRRLLGNAAVSPICPSIGFLP